jgi:hypothetical protein
MLTVDHAEQEQATDAAALSLGLGTTSNARGPRRNSQDLWIGVSRDLLITTL